MMPKRYLIHRNIMRWECPWLENDIPAGQYVYATEEETIPGNVSVSWNKSGKNPFDLPEKAVVER